MLSVGESLVVEDELLVLMMIEGMLADIGCDCVTAAATVDKALALIGAQVCDTAMLDMNLNGATGHSVAEALVARGLPFCLLHSQQRLHLAYRRCCRLDLADKVPRPLDILGQSSRPFPSQRRTSPRVTPPVSGRGAPH